MNCPKCQFNNPQTALFCSSCGASLKEAKKPFLRRHKGWVIGITITVAVFIFIVLPIILISSSISSLSSSFEKAGKEETVVSGSGQDKIALVNLNGLIVETEPQKGLGSVSEEVTSSRNFKKILQDVAKDDKVKIVLLKVNSPGGSAAASEEIYQQILNFKKESNKKVVAYFSDLAASGGYYISMAADNILANPANITGSIGVIIEGFNFTELAQKYGVADMVFKSGPHKDILNPLRKPTDEEVAIMQTLVNDVYDTFVQRVVTGRNLPESEVRRLADGRIYSAKQALNLKLIDKLGTFEDAVNLAKELASLKEAAVVEFGKKGFFEALFGAVTRGFNLSISPPLGNYFDYQTGRRLLYLYNP